MPVESVRDVGEVIVAGVAGAVSGALAATGVGIAGQIVGSAHFLYGVYFSLVSVLKFRIGWRP